MHQSEFHASIEEKVEQNCNDADEEKVDLDNNYGHFSQLRANKNVDEVRRKHPLQVDIPAEQPKARPANKTLGTASSCMPKITVLKGDKTFNAPMFPDEELLRTNRYYSQYIIIRC